MVHRWWSDDTDEIYWMEITRRDDIGGDLKAPTQSRKGGRTAGYLLVQEVRPGDVVIHYDSVSRSVVGVSRATAERWNAPLWWAPRGTTAREVDEKPAWRPAVYVGLEDFRALSQPVTHDIVEARKADILRVIDETQAYAKRTAGVHNAVYPPFTKQGGIRAYQSYFAKFPRRLLDVLPELRTATEELLGNPPTPLTDPISEIEQALAEVEEAAGLPTTRQKGRRQGRRLDPLVRAAVESHAMNVALDYYAQRGIVENTAIGNPFDYRVYRDGEEWHIEVKGTQTKGEAVLLTPNEVAHARSWPRLALFIVSEIVVTPSVDGPIASGGVVRLLEPWAVDQGPLVPTGFEHQPAGASTTWPVEVSD